LWLFFLLVSATSLYSQERAAARVVTTELQALAWLERDKVETSEPQRLMDTLGIQPGREMTILDIGAGTGQWSYAFAGRLEGSGRIYATEIDPPKVAYIEKEAQRKGYRNIHPALVSPTGVDPFYRRQMYDLIFASHVFYFIDDPTQYFAELGNYLNKAGKLVVIVVKRKRLFSPDDFSDFQGLVGKLREKPEKNIFYRNLDDSTKDLLRDFPAAGGDTALMEAVADDFNAMLDEASFHTNFNIEQLPFLPEERRHVEWLLGFVEEGISYDGRTVTYDDEAQNRTVVDLVRFLNKLLIHQHFRDVLSGESLHASPLDGVVTNILVRSGYVLKQSLDFHPFNFTLVFERE